MIKLNNFFIASIDDLKNYEWFNKYKVPNENLQINQDAYDAFWYFISERMNIFYKRVILEEEAPWTTDPLLQKYKFTNVIRDIDALTLYERQHILDKLDESTQDLDLRKKSVLLNIFIYRLWVKPDTYEVHGFIDLSNPNWKESWNKAKIKLLDRREKGISNFTNAYFVCGLQKANPDKSTRTNKTLNACYLIESWMDNMDEIYEQTIIKAKNMDEQLEYLRKLPYVGKFNAYEIACSIAITSRYCKNPLVLWTQDNSTSVGPGAHKGLQFMFQNYGGLSEYELILYLRSIWKHELQQCGTYDRFITQLPKEMNGDIDLRVIEHCLCELQKYWKVKNGLGRPKISFKPSHDSKDLKLGLNM